MNRSIFQRKLCSQTFCKRLRTNRGEEEGKRESGEILFENKLERCSSANGGIIYINLTIRDYIIITHTGENDKSSLSEIYATRKFLNQIQYPTVRYIYICAIFRACSN